MTGKGKGVDQSTEWGDWVWDPRGFHFASRTGPTGLKEYDYRYPEHTPRYQPNIAEQQQGNTTVIQSINPTSSSNTGYQTTPLYTTSPLIARETNVRAPAVTQTNYGHYTTSSYLQPPLRTNSLTKSYHPPLDSRYVRIPNHDPDKFWTFGRVFMTIWGEPAQEARESEAVRPASIQDDKSQYSEGYLGTRLFSEVRRFVVIRPGYGSSICSPIHTYNSQATLKPNLPEVNKHTIIYTTDKPPDFHEYTAMDGTVVKESLAKDAIQVNKATAADHLDSLSRLNYSKIYTVEHYVQVADIGVVAKDSLPSLKANSYLLDDPPDPQPPQKHPPSSSRHNKRKGEKLRRAGRG